MEIEIELFGQLSPGTPRRQIIHLEQPVSVEEVANRLGLISEEIGLISINGVQSELEDIVTPDCRLCFFPPMSGG